MLAAILFLFVPLFCALFLYVYRYFVKDKISKYASSLSATIRSPNMKQPPWEKLFIDEQDIILDEYSQFVMDNVSEGEEQLLSVLIDDKSASARAAFPITRALLRNIPRYVSARIDPIAAGKSVIATASSSQREDGDITNYIFLLAGGKVFIERSEGEGQELEIGRVYLFPEAYGKNSEISLYAEKPTLILSIDVRDRGLIMF